MLFALYVPYMSNEFFTREQTESADNARKRLFATNYRLLKTFIAAVFSTVNRNK